LILNEGYEKNNNLFFRAQDEKIFTKNKRYIDLSMCAGSILLGHNHKVFQKSIKKFLI
jgi:glutamate-1-semialdehyde aminotransferase